MKQPCRKCLPITGERQRRDRGVVREVVWTVVEYGCLPSRKELSRLEVPEQQLREVVLRENLARAEKHHVPKRMARRRPVPPQELKFSHIPDIQGRRPSLSPHIDP